jgi:type III pantothenate kinase
MHASDDKVIAIDVGNTSLRCGAFAAPSALPVPLPDDTLQLAARELDFNRLDAWLPTGVCHCYVASVFRAADKHLCEWLRENRCEMRVTLLRPKDFPIEVDVKISDLVGSDRLAAATAAQALRNLGQPVIVVDSGTAITVDAVDRDGRFVGGAIAPGWRMSAEALHRVTDLLPLVKPIEDTLPPPAIGDDTDAAIRSGLFWGSIGMVRELIGRLQTELAADCDVLITGGGAQMLSEHLGGENVKSLPDLVLSGIVIAGRELSR